MELPGLKKKPRAVKPGASSPVPEQAVPLIRGKLCLAPSRNRYRLVLNRLAGIHELDVDFQRDLVTHTETGETIHTEIGAQERGFR